MKTYATDNLPVILQNFIADYSKVYRSALIFAVNQRLAGFSDKSKLNTLIQQTFKINKRQAGALIADADGKVDAAKKCRANHIEQLEGKLKSAKDWLRKAEKALKDARKHYSGKWQDKKQSTNLKLFCYLDTRQTSWQRKRFAIHHKKRYVTHLERQVAALKLAQVRVTVSKQGEAYFVGSKGETCGNQVFQFDGATVKVRVPECLKAKYGEAIECSVNPFPYGQDKLEQALATTGFSTNKKTGQQSPIRYGLALTHRFYAKDFRWFWAVTVDLPPIRRVTRPRQYGCIGIDINPKSIGYAVVNHDGNLVVKGRLPFDVSSKRRGQTLAILADVCNSLINLALCYGMPICFENLEFSAKKAQLRERGRKYARMLSNFAYSRFIEQLTLQCGNAGIETIQRNPAWSSFLALVKYARMYGMSSDEAAALVLARRAMNLSERLPRSITALLGVNPRKHVWSGINQLNKILTGMSRHDFYSVSNWELKVKPLIESAKADRVKGKL
jgi:IS605 OrfB family transposase